MPRNRIFINTSPFADRYAGRRPDERIIEIESPNGGGLISFTMHDDGTLTIEPYRLDDTVTVTTPRRDDTVKLTAPCECGGTFVPHGTNPVHLDADGSMVVSTACTSCTLQSATYLTWDAPDEDALCRCESLPADFTVGIGHARACPATDTP